MITISKEELKGLYDKDFPLWAEVNYELLKEKLYELVDWENLLEEIRDMARKHLDSCISQLARILEHLYKWDNLRGITKAGKEKGGYSWVVSVEDARDEIRVYFKKYPSLKAKLPNELDNAWIDAVKEIRKWLRKTGYDPDNFNIPEECPYTYEEAMNRDLRKEVKNVCKKSR